MLKTALRTIYQWQLSHNILSTLLIGHILFALMMLLRSLGLMQGLELYAYDIMLWMRPTQPATDERVVVVWVTDKDQQRFNHPIPDTEMALAFEKILVHQPVAIGLDIYRDLPVPPGGGSGYEHLQRIFRENSNIIAIEKASNEFSSAAGQKVSAPPALKDTNQTGFNDIPDENGITRRGLLYLSQSDTGQVLDYFGLKMAYAWLFPRGIYANEDPDNPHALKLGKATLVPLDANFGGYTQLDNGGFQFMQLFPGAPHEFASVTLSEVLMDKVPAGFFKDKLVVIGIRAEATPDFLYPSFNRWLEGDNRVAGAAVHSYAISQLLLMAEGKLKPMQSWSDTEEILWIWLWTVFGAVMCSWTRSALRFSLLIMSGNIALAGICFIAYLQSVWVILATPALGWIMASVLTTTLLSYQEKHQRAVLMQLFSKHVSKEVAEIIWREREQYLNAGRLVSQRLTATIMFTDLQSFTMVSERMEPQALMDWLNEYMSCMVKIVEQHHGQVNKFIGDAVMALFGAPVASNSEAEIRCDALNAVSCALAMRVEMIRLRENWKAQGLPQIRMRIGIFTGSVVAGSLGGIERQEYTVIGDTVNTASRLESYDKKVDMENPCRILIGQSTLDYISDQFEAAFVGEVHLKGKTQSIKIYSVIGHRADVGKISAATI